MEAHQFVSLIIDDENKALKQGLNKYDKERVNMAIVHARTDVIHVVYELAQIKQLLKYILWVMFACLLVLIWIWRRSRGGKPCQSDTHNPEVIYGAVLQNL